MPPSDSPPPPGTSELPVPELIPIDGGGSGVAPVSIEPLAPEAIEHHRHNLIVTVLFQTILRCGWIFKTESIVMPAVMSTMGASGWLRGFLPALSKFGMSIPPLLMASRIRTVGRKKWLVFVCTGVMASCFLTLAVIWAIVPVTTSWLPALFLAIYVVFFMAVGMNNLVGNTIQGKLIQVRSRGRVLKLASFWGAVFAILLAGLLMPGWLEGENGKFHLIFGFAGFCFAIAAVCTLLLKEHRDDFRQQDERPIGIFRNIVRTLREDRHFRRLCLVGALFSVSIMLFPHYQPMGKDELDFSLKSIVLWVIVQNAGTGLFSVVMGPIADRHGCRRVLRLILLMVAVTPLLAVTLANSQAEWSRFYWSVFLLIGLTPVVIKVFHNYTLEMAPPSEHTRYLAVMSLCVSGPLMASPIAGLSIDLFSYTPVFIGVSATVSLAWLLTFTLLEPRDQS